MIGRVILAIVIAAVVGLVLTYLLGPILIDLKIPIAKTVGQFFVEWGWVLGVLAGLWYFFSNRFPFLRGG